MANAKETASRLLAVLDRLVEESDRRTVELARAKKQADAMEAELFRMLDRRAAGEAPGLVPIDVEMAKLEESEPKTLDEIPEESLSFRQRLDLVQSLAMELGLAGVATEEAREILECLATIRKQNQAEVDVPFSVPELPPLDDPTTRHQQAAEFFRGLSASFNAISAPMEARAAQSDAALKRAHEAARRIDRSLGA